MTATVAGPVVPRRRIARELKILREDHGLRLEQLAEKTDVSTSTLSRLENAQGAANPLTIKALVNFYKIADTELGENLIKWSRDGRKPGWWQGHPGNAQEANPSYIAYESQASEMRMFVIPFLPTLLQTYDYALVLARRLNPDRTDEDIEGMVELRRERKKMLRVRDGQAPLRARIILHEVCLTQVVGSVEVMRAQLSDLLRVIESLRDTLLVQVMERTAPPHRAMQCPWAHFSYPDNVGSASFIDTHIGLKLYEDPKQMESVAQDFEELSAQSLDREASIRFIEQVLATHY